MNNEILSLDSIIKKGKFNGKTVNQIIENDRKEIINLVKKGYSFSDEVFEKAKFKHQVRDNNIVLEVVDKPKTVNKPLNKDTEKLENIIESLSTISNCRYINDIEETFTKEEIDEIE